MSRVPRIVALGRLATPRGARLELRTAPVHGGGSTARITRYRKGGAEMSAVAHPIAMAQLAAERLQGSAQSLANLGPEFEALQNDSVFCAELDQLVFECECCGWWCDAGEMSDSESDNWECLECTEGGRR